MKHLDDKEGDQLKINEENFIKELKNKNEDALYYVIDNYAWILKTVISKHLFHLQNYEEECLNDALLGIWNNIDYFNPEKSSFKNWIAGIAKYKSIDYIRKYLKDTDNLQIDELFISDRKDNLDILLELEGEKNLINSIKLLSKRDQDIFTDLYLNGLSIEEVALKTNLKKSNLYNILSRGRNKLKKEIKKEAN